MIEPRLIVYRGLSDTKTGEVLREGFIPSHGEDKVYTTISFSEAVRFAYSHTRSDGGNPIIYELDIPISMFKTQIFYDIKPFGWKAMGYLTSGPLSATFIRSIIKIPIDPFEAGKIISQKEKEEKMREDITKTLLEKIPQERVEG